MITKRFNVRDDASFRDLHNLAAQNRKDERARGNMGLLGLVDFRDAETGEVLIRKRSNLILLRGRTFMLERIFDDTVNDPGSEYIENKNRSVCLFKIGTGGVGGGSTFSPDPPAFDDMSLVTPVPFRQIIHTTEDKGVILGADEVKYWPSVDAGGAGNTYSFDLKMFEDAPSGGRFTINKIGDEVFYKATLKVTSDDARGHNINELGLFIANDTGNTNDFDVRYTEIEPFSRITFPTEPLSAGSRKSLLIEYYVYA